ncbi:MAG: hypothetical protein ACJAWL_003020 [Motiliproteus sp.]|jgi:hypothetical protein
MEASPSTLRKSPAGYLLFGLFFVSCPCHLIFVIPLISGTLLGSYLNEHYLLIFGVLLMVSLVSGLGSMRLLDRR